MLSEWVSLIENLHGDRILPVDLETVGVWAEISTKADRSGRPLSVIDGLIAATAMRHGLTLVTRNARDFEATGVLLVNPWKP